MRDEQDFSPKKQIRNFLIVSFSGVAFAFIAVYLMVNFYGPSGKYTLKNALLSPTVIPQLNYNGLDPKTGGDSRFIFDSLTFSYFNLKTGKEDHVLLDLDQYTKIYQLLSNDRSILDAPREVMDLFKQANLATLVISVRTESKAKWQADKKVFQEVAFVLNGDHYRLMLHEDETQGNLVYFYHPQVYHDILQIVKRSYE